MAIGADVATTEPAAIVATVMRAKVHVGVDGAPAAPAEGDHGWGRTVRLGTFISPLLTGLAQRFVNQPGEGLGGFGASTSGWSGRRERMRHTGWVVVQPDMKEQED
jgi:hypothetical protein